MDRVHQLNAEIEKYYEEMVDKQKVAYKDKRQSCLVEQEQLFIRGYSYCLLDLYCISFTIFKRNFQCYLNNFTSTTWDTYWNWNFSDSV